MSTDDEREGPRDQGEPEGCPGPEVLAAFLDGALEGREKRGVQGHLATCSDCYALFGESAEFLRESPLPAVRVADPAPPVGSRTRIATWVVPLALAATLVLVLLRPSRVSAPTTVVGRGTEAATPLAPSLPALVPTPAASAPSPSVAGVLVGPLLNVDDPAPLTGAAWSDEPAGRGFAGGPSRERALVLLGVHLLDLEVAIRRGQLLAARERLASLEPHAESIAGGPAIQAFRSGLTGPRLASLDTADLRAQLERGAARGSPDASRLIRFGEWVEACRLAAAVRHARYFVLPEVRQGLIEAGELPLTKPMRRSLTAIGSLLEPHPVSETEWRRLERTLRDVLLLL